MFNGNNISAGLHFTQNVSVLKERFSVLKLKHNFHRHSASPHSDFNQKRLFNGKECIRDEIDEKRKCIYRPLPFNGVHSTSNAIDEPMINIFGGRQLKIINRFNLSFIL